MSIKLKRKPRKNPQLHYHLIFDKGNKPIQGESKTLSTMVLQQLEINIRKKNANFVIWLSDDWKAQKRIHIYTHFIFNKNAKSILQKNGTTTTRNSYLKKSTSYHTTSIKKKKKPYWYIQEYGWTSKTYSIYKSTVNIHWQKIRTSGVGVVIMID